MCGVEPHDHPAIDNDCPFSTRQPLPALQSGGRAGNRTQNLAIKSRLLCQLSYSSKASTR